MSNEHDKQPADDLPEGADAPADATNDPEAHIATTVLPDGDGIGDDNGDVPAADEGTSLEDALAKAEATAEENWNKYLRAVAELDNVRKRATRDLENARCYGVEGLANELLGVVDSLEMGLSAENATADALREGKAATLKLLQTVLDKHGITIIDPEGEPFDPELHEAMSMQESTTAEPDSVLTVVQRGYQLNGRLLRPARVIVAKEPS